MQRVLKHVNFHGEILIQANFKQQEILTNQLIKTPHGKKWFVESFFRWQKDTRQWLVAKKLVDLPTRQGPGKKAASDNLVRLTIKRL